MNILYFSSKYYTTHCNRRLENTSNVYFSELAIFSFLADQIEPSDATCDRV